MDLKWTLWHDLGKKKEHGWILFIYYSCIQMHISSYPTYHTDESGEINHIQTIRSSDNM